MTEHWLEPEEPFDIPGYYVVSNCCRLINTGYGGTSILVNRDSASYFELENMNKYNHLYAEGIFEFSLAYSKKNNIYILCVYRPPVKNSTGFLINLETILLDLPPNSGIVCTGDFNLDYNSDNLAGTVDLKNLMLSYDLKMFVNSPTRITDRTATTIDYFCTNFSHDNVRCEVLSNNLSDHEALLSSFPIQKLSERVPAQHKRIFSSKNFNNFREKVSVINWESVLESEMPIDVFHLVVRGVFLESFPLRKMRERKKKKNWITGGIRISSLNLRSLCVIRKFTDNDCFVNYFRTYRRIYKSIIRTAKQKYYEDRIDNSQNKSKEAWAIVNDLRSKNSVLRRTADINVDALNAFYCTVGRNLTSNIRSDWDPMKNLSRAYVRETFVLVNTNQTEIKMVIREIKTNSAGIDEMSKKIFQNLDDAALEALAHSINASFANGQFPNILKTALVIPLHKSGSFKDPSNFRPISLLSTLSKIIEKLAKKRMMEFIEKHNILSVRQFAYQKSKNTNDAVFSFLESLYLKLNDREVASAVFCDFSKAFDCVNHILLLKKMEIYGFRGISGSFFKSYLTGRYQKVKNGTSFSSTMEVSTGVPQGSVLGAILFLLYINDLNLLDIKGLVTIFADDTTILWHHKDEHVLKEIVNSDIRLIKEWCDANYLCLNIDKTKVLGFKMDFEDLNLDEQRIEQRPNVKFLGMFIDDQLKFTEHVVNLNKKISRGGFAVRRTHCDLGYQMARKVYFALVESHLRYGIAFWGNCCQSLLRSVFTIQKRCVRYICGARLRDHCKPLFQREKILTVISLFILETACIIFKKYRGNTSLHEYETRNSSNILLPVPKFTLTQNSVIYRGIKIYNKLPTNIKSTDDLNVFKESIKDMLVNKAYYNLDEFFNDS